MTAADMESRLKQKYQDAQVAVIDTNGDGYHFEVRICAPELDPLSRIERHQQVMAVFRQELDSGEVHAMTIKTLKL